jgi:hypothetical protein
MRPNLVGDRAAKYVAASFMPSENAGAAAPIGRPLVSSSDDGSGVGAGGSTAVKPRPSGKSSPFVQLCASAAFEYREDAIE